MTSRSGSMLARLETRTQRGACSSGRKAVESRNQSITQRFQSLEFCAAPHLDVTRRIECHTPLLPPRVAHSVMPLRGVVHVARAEG